jgi:hypothetical protein
MGKDDEICGKSIGLKFVKRATRMSKGVTESQELGIMEGWATSETEEPISAVSVRIAGNV